MILDRV